jgi:class 3 adenylate cyclase/tetratricopeptide (TPR) repeat protein
VVRQLPEGTVTVLFTDVEGSTELAARAGDAAARDLLRATEELARTQVEAHDGHEVKGLGDGLMVAFTSARRAVQCAVEMQRSFEERNLARPDEAVRLRIGLNTGEVIREQADLFGSTVNAAARIESRAEAGQILASESLRGVLGAGSDIEFVDRGQFRLKGFAERWQLYEVPWRREATGPAAFARRTPFVGREHERAQLRVLLGDASRGHGALAMLVGEPGIGKTRLTEEVVTEARSRGFLTLTGHCYEMEGAPPYIPFVEALEMAERVLDPDVFRASLGDDAPQVAKLVPQLRRLFPTIAPAVELPPEQERRYLLNSLRDYVERSASSQPLLLVLEDLHWADESTMLLLAHLAERLDQMAVVVIGSYRDTDLDVAQPLARTLDDLTRRRLMRRVALDRLTEEVVTAMLRARSGQEPPPSVVGVIYRETEGNPFFVEETFQYLAEEGKLIDEQGQWRTDIEVSEVEVPEGVRLVIGRRLERVSEACQRILASAAAIGRAFTFALLGELVDVDEDGLLDAIDEAERAGLLSSAAVAGEAQLTFAHEQIRQTLLANLSLPRRQRLHLRVAEAIERAAGASTDEHAADLAHHLYQAGAAADTERTVRYLVLAGDQATTATAFEDALRLYEDALTLQPDEDTRERADLLLKRGLARRSLGRWDVEQDDWYEALAIYAKLGDSEAIGRLCVDMAWALLWVGRIEDATAIASRGLEALGEQLTVERCWLLAMTSGITAWAPPPHGDIEAADVLYTQALMVARELGGSQLEEALQGFRGSEDVAWWRLRRAIDEGYPGGDALRAMGRLWELAEMLSWVHVGQVVLGDLEEADRVAEEVEREVVPLGHGGAVWLSRSGGALRDVMLAGDLAAFAERSGDLLDFGTDVGIPWIYASHGWAGLAHFWAGRWEEALGSLETGAELELVAGPTRGQVSGPLLRLAAYRREKEQALAILDERRTYLPHAGRSNTFGSWTFMACAVEALALLGENERAADLYGAALEAIETGAAVFFDGCRLLETIAGIAATCGEKWEAAEQHFGAALRQAHEVPHRVEQPEVRRWHAWMLLSRDESGDRDRARELLTEAIEMYGEIGMPKHLEIAETVLAEVGG